MLVEHVSAGKSTLFRRIRADVSEHRWRGDDLLARLLWLTLAVGFVLVGGGSLELDWSSARIGLAAAEAPGPLGQVYGLWEPSILPAQVLPVRWWSFLEGARASTGSVRWPAAIAAVVASWIVSRRVGQMFGPRAKVFCGLATLSSLAFIDRSALDGTHLLTGLAIVAALDRVVHRGSDLAGGFWAALALLAGGWPAVLLLFLASFIVRRPREVLSWRLLVPPLAAFAAWSFWAWSLPQGRVAWVLALSAPLKQSPVWLLPGWVAFLTLPWSPFAVLLASRSVREGWSNPGRALVRAWLQIAAVSLLAGAMIPGLASAALIPSAAGIAVGAAAVLDRAWSRSLPDRQRRAFVGIALSIILFWAVFAAPTGTYFALADPFYRKVSLIVIAASVVTAFLAIEGAWFARTRGMLVGVAVVAACLKLAHWGYYVPEWNYRFGQGPWGRAIGQHVPPNWPIYTTHRWNADLALATDRPVRQIAEPAHLTYKITTQPVFVLLSLTEFEHWPPDAPALIKVRSFEDELGDSRILARTPGEIINPRRAAELEGDGEGDSRGE